MEPVCMAGSHTNNLPTPTDLTENHYGKKTLFLKAADQKLATLVVSRTTIELQPTWPIFDAAVLLLFASLPDCSQNQTAVSDTLRLLSDF